MRFVYVVLKRRSQQTWLVKKGLIMNIGEAAKASKVSAKMIRYYERTGLIPPAARTDSGYRFYTPADIQQLHFIRRSRDLGFSVAEISDLLSLWNDQSRQSADVKRLAEQHIAELEKRIASMRHMTETLKNLIRSCAGDDRPDCPILNTLEQPDGQDDVPAKARTGAVQRRS
jgi:MerR family gold-responsive transcriptional activator of gol and ges genes